MKPNEPELKKFFDNTIPDDIKTIAIGYARDAEVPVLIYREMQTFHYHYLQEPTCGNTFASCVAVVYPL